MEALKSDIFAHGDAECAILSKVAVAISNLLARYCVCAAIRSMRSRKVASGWRARASFRTAIAPSKSRSSDLSRAYSRRAGASAADLVSLRRSAANDSKARSRRPARRSRRAKYHCANPRRGWAGSLAHRSSSFRDNFRSARYSSSNFAKISARSTSCGCLSMKSSSTSSPVSGVFNCKCASAIPQSAAITTA